MDYDRYLENERIKNDLQEVPVIYNCDRCGGEIYKGNPYYETDTELLCEDCFDKMQAREKQETERIAGEE